METNFEDLKLLVLNETEMLEITGGAHYEWIDGELVFVQDQ